MLDYSLKITNFGWLSESDAQVSSLDIFKFANKKLTNYFNTTMLFYIKSKNKKQHLKSLICNNFAFFPSDT